MISMNLLFESIFDGIRIAGVMVCVCSCHTIVLAQTETGKNAKPQSAATQLSIDLQHVDELIQLLSDTKYDVREAATEKLVAMGDVVVPTIASTLTDDQADEETRQRCKNILKRLVQLRKNKEVDDFINMKSDTPPSDWNHWERFHSYLGVGQDSRTLFVSMMKPESKAILDWPQNDLPAYRDQLLELYRNRDDPFERNVIAALLFRSCDNETTGLDDCCTCSIVNRYFRSDVGNEDETMTKLAGKWIATHQGTTTGMRRLMTGWNLELAETAVLARRILADDSVSTNRLSIPILAIGKFGDKEDLPLLQKVIERMQTDDAGESEKIAQSKRRNRDTALAMSIILDGKKLSDFEFSEVTNDRPADIESANDYFLESEKEFQRIFRKWNATKLNTEK